MSSEYVVVLTTLPADADAATFARTLVDERLAACVNLLASMESVYRWEGRVEHVVSGQVTHVHSLEELLAFIRRVLPDVQPP